jgi:hypothetical protein
MSGKGKEQGQRARQEGKGRGCTEPGEVRGRETGRTVSMGDSGVLLEASSGEEGDRVFGRRVRELLLVELDRLGVYRTSIRLESVPREGVRRVKVMFGQTHSSEDGSEVVVGGLDRGVDVDGVKGSGGPLDRLQQVKRGDGNASISNAFEGEKARKKGLTSTK